MEFNLQHPPTMKSKKSATAKASPASFITVATCDPNNSQDPSTCEHGYAVYRLVGVSEEIVDSFCTDG